MMQKHVIEPLLSGCAIAMSAFAMRMVTTTLKFCSCSSTDREESFWQVWFGLEYIYMHNVSFYRNQIII